VNASRAASTVNVLRQESLVERRAIGARPHFGGDARSRLRSNVRRSACITKTRWGSNPMAEGTAQEHPRAEDATGVFPVHAKETRMRPYDTPRTLGYRREER
jgi:hypothetical protein